MALEGLAIAVLVGGVLGCAVVLIIHDVRRRRAAKNDPRLQRIAQSPHYPWYETLKPGETPILKECVGYKQGGLITLTCFRGLWGSPQSGDASKPPTSTERSSQ